MTAAPDAPTSDSAGQGSPTWWRQRSVLLKILAAAALLPVLYLVAYYATYLLLVD